MLAKKSLGIIIGASAAAILVIVVVLGQTELYKNEFNILPESQTPIEPADKIPLQTYRINTECELIYGFASGKYPDGEKLPQIKIADLLVNYPDEFGPWKTTLENNETRAEFFKQPLSTEFSDVLTVAIMKESSIKPELKPIAGLITDPQGKTKMQQAYQQYNCKSYFDEKAKQ